MQKHSNARARAPQLPSEQLPLPGIEPLPKSRFSLPDTVTATINKHRYPILITAVIVFLCLIGQGFIAGSIAAGSGLYLINTTVDKYFAAALDKIQKGGDQ